MFNGEPTPDPGGLVGVHAELHAGLLEGMHALAQPLTLLRSLLYLGNPGGSVQLFNDVAAGVEDVCTVVRLMQGLIQLDGVAAQLEEVPVAEVLRSIAEHAEAVLAGTGMRLDLAGDLVDQAFGTAAARGPRVQSDRKRTAHALAGMVHVAREAAAGGTNIACVLLRDGNSVTISVGPIVPSESFTYASMDEVTRLYLAFARANITSQQATFRVATDPLTMSVTLPLVLDQV
jgi:hypothetical protein